MALLLILAAVDIMIAAAALTILATLLAHLFPPSHRLLPIPRATVPTASRGPPARVV